MKENYFNANFIQKWQKRLKERKLVFKFEKSALLIIDMQKYFMENEGDAFVPASKYILEKIKGLAKFYKDNSLPIVLTRHIDNEKKHPMMKKWWESPILERDPQSQLISYFNFLKEYPIFIKKNYYDAFKETGLKQILKGRGVEKVLIGGVLTNCCCETTARSAFMNNFEVFFLFDGTATYKKEYHESTILNISYGFGEILFFKDLFPPGEIEENLENQKEAENLSEK